MKITKDMLDKKICELEECSSDTLTYRDWIREHCTQNNEEHCILEFP